VSDRKRYSTPEAAAELGQTPEQKPVCRCGWLVPFGFVLMHKEHTRAPDEMALHFKCPDCAYEFFCMVRPIEVKEPS